MITTPPSHLRRFGLRLVSRAKALLAVSESAALAVSHRVSSRALKSLCLAAVCGSFAVPASAATQTLTILGGNGNPGDVAANVEYLNPATNKWQQAYLANYTPYNQPVTHPWGNIPGTNRWINYKTDGGSDAGASASNPLWYRYRVRFTVPSDAVNPKMTFSLKADNRANVWINGASTGSTIVGAADQLNADAVFAQNVFPGENTITLDIGDEGGLNGFNFRIDLSMESSQPLGLVAAGAPTTFDSKPTLNVPANITVNATSAAGATVTFNPTASSNETVEIFRRDTATAENWASYSNTFVSGVTGTFNLSFNVISTNNGDHSVFIDDVKLKSGASTLFSDGFESPNVPSSSGNFAGANQITLGAWTFTNYGGIMQGPAAQDWGSIANGPSPEGSQHAVIRNVLGVQTKMKSVSQISVVAGQTYTLSFQQASRELVGLDGDLIYTVTLERVISVPVEATPDSGSTFPIGTTTVNLSATTNGGTTTGAFNVTVKTIPVTITLGNLVHTYDGSVKLASATTSPINVPVNLSHSGVQVPPVNVGNYGVIATVSLPYSSNVTTGTLVINKASSTTTTNGDGPFTYDGTTHTGGSGTVTGAGGLSTAATSLTYSGDQVNAGSYTVTAHYAGDANHLPSDGAPVTIKINKAASTTTTIGEGPFTFDGTTRVGGSGTVTGAGGLSAAATSLTYSGDQVNAGSYTVTAHYAGDANHLPSDGAPVTITINKASSATTTIGDGPFTYDGTTHAGGSGTVTGVGGLSAAATSLTYSGDQVNAGSYTVTAHYAGDANHLPSDGAPVTVTINKASSATATIGDGPFTYDGTTHAGGSGAVTGAGGLSTAATSLTYSGDQVNAGSYTVTAHYAGDANHFPSDGAPVTITIDKASSATTTIGDGPFTYDGTTRAGGSGTVTGAGGLSAAATSLTYSGDQVNAGSYTVTAHYAGDANHLPSDGAPVAITIDKASSATTTIGDGPFTYDGTTRAGGSGTVTGAGGLSAAATSLTYSGDQVNAGSYSVTAHYAGDANHLPSDGAPVTITINKANATVVVTPYSLTYDGNPHTAAVSIGGMNGETGATVGTVTLDSTHTNAGTYSADSWSFTGAANYNDIAKTTLTNTINKANATINVTPYSVIYNANPHTALGTAKGVKNESLSGLDLSGTTHTNAGTTTDSWTFTDTTGNYHNASGTVSDTIEKAPSLTVVTINGGPFTYNGSAQTPATVAVTGVGGLSLTPNASYANNTNAGTATASYTYGGDSNHLGSGDSKTFEIAKASSTTVVTINGGPFTYNGSAQTPATVSVTGAGGLSLTPTASYANNTNVGTATASYTYGGDSNHNGSSDSKSFAIAKSPTKATLGAVPTIQALGQTVTLTATVVPVAPGGGSPDGTVTFSIGATVLGTATVNGSGVATLATTAIPIGPQTITATYSGSSNFTGITSNTVSILIYGYPTGGGTFVIGDGNSAVGATVNFWGSQWEKNNSLSGGTSNASFKGFAGSMTGTTFAAAPGNSGPSPATVPSYLAVIVTSKVTKSGSNISGTVVKLVVVKTNPGYAGDPGSPGTGTVIAVIP